MQSEPLHPYQPLAAEALPTAAPFAYVTLRSSADPVALVARPVVRIAPPYEQASLTILAVQDAQVVGRLSLRTRPERVGQASTRWEMGHVEVLHRGAGLGLSLYLGAAAYLHVAQLGAGIASFGSRKPAATACWERLVRAGLAVREGEPRDPRFFLPALVEPVERALEGCWAARLASTAQPTTAQPPTAPRRR